MKNDKVDLVRLNWLRAGVLGANDGIVSVASILVGVVAAATQSSYNLSHFVLVSGVAGLFAGAMSMAAGEYVSVSTQKDAEMKIHSNNGVTDGEVTNPWHAAFASFVAFLAGGIIPILAVVLSASLATITQVIIIVLSVLFALFLTGLISSSLGDSSRGKAIIRNIIGGSFAMLITYVAGTIFGALV